jgi:hypothetical protein
MERHNDPTLCAVMPNIPNIDITKLLPKEDKIETIITKALHTSGANPFQIKKGH